MRARRIYRELGCLFERDRAAVEADHRSRLSTTLTAARQTDFYRKRLQGLPDDFDEQAYQAIPELRRDDLRRYADDMLNPHSPHPPQADATGGSTGTPTPFYRTAYHRAHSHAMDNLTASWVGGGFGSRTVVLWGAQTLEADRNPMGWRQRLAFHLRGGVWILDCLKMTRSRWDVARQVIESKRPRLIRGYRSILLEFARYLEETGPLQHRPRGILSAAELLLPEHRERIETVLGVPVFDRYGSREMGLAAAECPKQRLHVSSPTIKLEVVSEAGVNVPGEPGYLVVTTLNNLAMPLIRYRIGDGASWEGYSCDCGLPLPVISMQQGREAAMMQLGDGTMVYPVFFHLHLRDHLEVESWQLVRRAPDQLELCLFGPSGISAETVKTIQDKFQTYLGAACALQVREVETLQRNRTGKVELVVDQTTS